MDEPLSSQALSDLIGSIYDCTLDASLWDQALGRVAEVLDAESIILSLNDLRHDRLVIDRSVGWEPSWLAERRRHMPEIHARLSEWLSETTSIDEPFVASRHLPPSYFDSSPYVRECLRPLSIVDITHLFLMHSPSHFAEIVVARREEQGIITDREVRLCRLLLPHLRRAVTISRVLDADAAARELMVETLDATACGVILTDRRGAILHINQAAESLVRQGVVIRDAHDVLRARTAAATRDLHDAIRQASDNETQLGSAGLAVHLGDVEHTPVIGHVLPMSGGEVRPRVSGDAVAAVFIAAEPDPGLEAATVAVAFGLTPAETRLLSSLLAGNALRETSDRLGIAATTARSHLDSIFRKTGVSRQADLARLAGRLAPPVRADTRGA